MLNLFMTGEGLRALQLLNSAMDFGYSYLLTAQNFSSEMNKQIFLESR